MNMPTDEKYTTYIFSEDEKEELKDILRRAKHFCAPENVRPQDELDELHDRIEFFLSHTFVEEK